MLGTRSFKLSRFKVMLLANSFFSLLSKVFGFVFLYALIYRFESDVNLPLFMLLWGYAMYFQGAVVLPLTHYCISLRSDFFLKKLTIICYLIFPFVFLIPGKGIFFALFLVMVANVKTDFYLISTGKYLIYNTSSVLKNIFGLIGILFSNDLNDVFLGYVLGDVVKHVVSVVIIRNEVFSGGGEGLRPSFLRFFKYSLYLLIAGGSLVVIKTISYNYAPVSVVQFEAVYRIFEVIFIAVTSGIMPIFLNHIKDDEYKNKIYLYSLGLVLVLSSCILFVLVVLGGDGILILLKLDLSKTSFFASIFIGVFLSFLLVLLSFKRKEFALSVSVPDVCRLLVVPLSIGLFFWLYIRITDFWLLPVMMGALLSSLILEYALILRRRSQVNV